MSDAPQDVRTCPLGCGAPGFAIAELPATTVTPLSRTHYTLVRCDCGKLLYLSPAPTPGDLKAIYVDQDQYGSEYTDPERVRAILGYIGDALRNLKPRAVGRRDRPLRVLEIGAGLSWMCRAAKADDPRSFTVAQDISPEALDKCPWVDHYIQGDVSDERLSRFAPFDIVSMTHVIEHLVEPVRVVARCRELMSPGGLLFVTAPHRPRGWDDATPDVRSWLAYPYNHVPAHIQYFSEDSLARLAHASDLELVYWSHDHEGGEAFEAWLSPRGSSPAMTRVDRAKMMAARNLRRVARAIGIRR